MKSLRILCLATLSALVPLCAGTVHAESGYEKDTGYRGIWYYNQKTGTEYVYKYSGGLGTYCAKHMPLAVYAPEVDKTFFVYGGTVRDKQELLETVSYYDHQKEIVPRPTVLINKQTEDAHDNPVISLDDQGHVWVFASSHGTGRPSYIFRGKKPHNIDDFDMVLETNFSYPQPWYWPGKGFLFLHTYYKNGRGLNWHTSEDGVNWTKRRLLAHMEHGHYQVSWPCFAEDGKQVRKVGTCFNYHPKAFNGDKKRTGLNWRTNLYYIETSDFGETWTTVDSKPVETPIKDPQSPALVRAYEEEGLLAYMKGVQYDAQGRPVLLYVTGKSWEPGPDYGPRTWTVAHWTGEAWSFSEVTASDNNYDTGALYVGADGLWRVIGPTETGPQPYNPGGEMAIWESPDQGKTWTKKRQLTTDSAFNHTYARQVLHGQPGFCTLWADGHARQPSESRLYFYDLGLDTVYRLPYEMDAATAKPEPLPQWAPAPFR